MTALTAIPLNIITRKDLPNEKDGGGKDHPRRVINNQNLTTMPNWCETTYRAVGEKEQVKRFYDIVMSSWNKSKDDNKGWMGHVITELGGDWQKVSCRGWIRMEPQLSKDGTECIVYADTAWGEPPEWREFIQQKIDGLFIFYIAIEPGCGVYISNDDAYDDKYYVDASEDQPDDPFMTEDELCDFLRKHFGADVQSIDDCLDFAARYNENNDDDFMGIYAMEVCDE